MSDVTFRHNVDRERFEVLVGGRVIGKAAYKTYDEGGFPQRIFYHTVINEEYGGQGLAGRLAEVALKETASEGLRIVPVCPFIKKFLTKHPEFEADTTVPTPVHLEYLSVALVPATRA